MQAYNVVYEELCEGGRVCCRLCGNEVCHLAEAIHNNENGVEVGRLGELGDQIDGYVLPGVFWGLEWGNDAIWFVMSGFGNLTVWACRDEIKDVCPKVGADEVA